MIPGYTAKSSFRLNHYYSNNSIYEFDNNNTKITPQILCSVCGTSFKGCKKACLNPRITSPDQIQNCMTDCSLDSSDCFSDCTDLRGGGCDVVTDEQCINVTKSDGSLDRICYDVYSCG